jgi:hypothetical protein
MGGVNRRVVVSHGLGICAATVTGIMRKQEVSSRSAGRPVGRPALHCQVTPHADLGMLAPVDIARPPRWLAHVSARA